MLKALSSKLAHPLPHQGRAFARYLNRSQQTAHQYKYDASAYKFKPELIYRIEPQPYFPDQDTLLPTPKEVEERAKYSEYLERFRQNDYPKSRLLPNAATGRLYAHFKQEEIKQQVAEIHSSETVSHKQRRSSAGGNKVPKIEYDDEFKLPYGFGYDKIIKKKTDLVNKAKFQNNRVMDELVEKLGYMDYRDALACNKYILEAKQHTDYHQQARAKVLSSAMARYKQKRKQEIEQRAAVAPGTELDSKDEQKLQVIMNEDPEMAQIYREAYEEAKFEKEKDYNEIKRIQDKYEYLFDPYEMSDKKPSDRFDLSKEKTQWEEEILSTELSDPQSDFIYKRYKIATSDLDESIEDLDQQAQEMLKAFQTGTAMYKNRSLHRSADLKGALQSIFQKKIQRKQFKFRIEAVLAKIRYFHAVKNLNPNDVYTELDPNFNSLPTDTRGIESDLRFASEFRKIYLRRIPETQDPSFPVNDEASSRAYEDFDELRTKYFRSKWDFYVEEMLGQFKLTTQQLEEGLMISREKDELVRRKAEFMYDYLDYENDRSRVRSRFMNEMNKKTTLKDIGEMLDRIIVDEKGQSAKYYDPLRKEQIKSAAQDSSSNDWSWSGRLMKQQNPIAPLLLDDLTPLENLPEGADIAYRDITERIKHDDAKRDHSYGTLTQDEKTEIALFHSLKQDPFFKHYLRNHLRQYAEEADEGLLNMPSETLPIHMSDFPKFDRINLYDFRRALPQKERQAKLDKVGAAWGHGKRKRCTAVARVKPGKGTITINGKPMLEYFFLPSQRYRMLLPLILTKYTALLDVDIWVHGGGLTGQCEAVVPALAKAIQSYDVRTRTMLKFFRLMRHDPRNVERKKYGRLKARKSQVYVRR